MLVDLCYQIVIENEDEFQKHFKFKNSLESVNFKRWYESDNVFVIEMDKALGCPDKNGNLQCSPDATRATQLKNLKQRVTKSIEDILRL